MQTHTNSLTPLPTTTCKDPTQIYTQSHPYPYKNPHLHKHTHIYKNIRVQIYQSIYDTHTHTHTYICMSESFVTWLAQPYIYIYMCVCVCVCVCVYTPMLVLLSFSISFLVLASVFLRSANHVYHRQTKRWPHCEGWWLFIHTLAFVSPSCWLVASWYFLPFVARKPSPPESITLINKTFQFVDESTGQREIYGCCFVFADRNMISNHLAVVFAPVRVSGRRHQRFLSGQAPKKLTLVIWDPWGVGWRIFHGRSMKNIWGYFLNLFFIFFIINLFIFSIAYQRV